MASVNSVTVIGNLGKDPEVRYMPDGSSVINFSLAASEKWTDKSGEKKEHTEWIDIVFFGRTAEVIAEYCKKGSSLYVTGRLKTRKYEKDGVTHYKTDVVGERMQFLGSKGGGRSEDDGEERTVNRSAKQQTQKPADPQGDFDDDIPF